MFKEPSRSVLLDPFWLYANSEGRMLNRDSPATQYVAFFFFVKFFARTKEIFVNRLFSKKFDLHRLNSSRLFFSLKHVYEFVQAASSDRRSSCPSADSAAYSDDVRAKLKRGSKVFNTY